MKQTGTLDNACGIIACIHSVLNNLERIQLNPGSLLDRFNKETADMTPSEKAVYLENFTEFKEEHKSHANQGQSDIPEQDCVKFHFIAFVKSPSNQLIELDGTKTGPVVIEEDCQSLIKGAAQEIKRRLEAGIITEQLSVMALQASAD